MNKRAGILLTGAALAIAGSFSVTARQAGAADFPSMTVPNTCGVQLKNNNLDNLDPIKSAGFGFVRRGFKWDLIEKEKGKYDFAAFDDFVKNCEERGIRILGCLALGNKFYGSVAEDEGRAAYVKYATATVEHFRGHNIIWEIWNEPNVCTFWGKRGTHNSEQFADEYTALVKAAVPEMKKADPACKILGGSVSNIWSASYNWTMFCFQKGILQTGIDGWAIHPYTPRKPEGHIEGYETMRSLMVKHGGGKELPMFNTERGFPLGKAEGYAGGDASKAPEYQAWHLVRQYMIDLACNIGLSNWYEWEGNEGFSLIDAKREPMPALKAAKVMIEQLRGYRFDKRIDLGKPDDFALRFTNPAGGIKLVLWTSPSGNVSPDLTLNHDAAVAVDATGTLPLSTLYGEAGTVAVKDGKVTLKLTGAPQYLTVKSK